MRADHSAAAVLVVRRWYGGPRRSAERGLKAADQENVRIRGRARAVEAEANHERRAHVRHAQAQLARARAARLLLAGHPCPRPVFRFFSAPSQLLHGHLLRLHARDTREKREGRRSLSASLISLSQFILKCDTKYVNLTSICCGKDTFMGIQLFELCKCKCRIIGKSRFKFKFS